MKYIYLLALAVLLMAGCRQKPQVSLSSSDGYGIDVETIESFDSEEINDMGSPLVQSILQQLGIKSEDCYMYMVDELILPYDENLVAVVIPRVLSEEEYGFELEACIVVANGETGNVVARFYGDNTLVSDAIRLENITIDTQDYQLNHDVHAFGVKTHYTGSSRVNPYSEENLSLFVIQGDTLRRVLKDFQVSKSTGDWDGMCSGTFEYTENTLEMADGQTNGFNNIIVNSAVTHTVATPIGNDCESEETVGDSSYTLIYMNDEYQTDSTGNDE